MQQRHSLETGLRCRLRRAWLGAGVHGKPARGAERLHRGNPQGSGFGPSPRAPRQAGADHGQHRFSAGRLHRAHPPKTWPSELLPAPLLPVYRSEKARFGRQGYRCGNPNRTRQCRKLQREGVGSGAAWAIPTGRPGGSLHRSGYTAHGRSGGE